MQRKLSQSRQQFEFFPPTIVMKYQPLKCNADLLANNKHLDFKCYAGWSASSLFIISIFFRLDSFDLCGRKRDETRDFYASATTDVLHCLHFMILSRQFLVISLVCSCRWHQSAQRGSKDYTKFSILNELLFR